MARPASRSCIKLSSSVAVPPASNSLPRLGNKLGRAPLADVTLIDKSRTHLWKPLLHEFAAGSMDQSVHELDFLAQAHWHHFRYRVGEMVGLDRTAPRRFRLAAYVDEEGDEVTPQRSSTMTP